MKLIIVLITILFILILMIKNQKKKNRIKFNIRYSISRKYFSGTAELESLYNIKKRLDKAGITEDDDPKAKALADEINLREVRNKLIENGISGDQLKAFDKKYDPFPF